jgi:hypothetical protein
VAAKAECHNTKPTLGEEVKKIHIPAPRALERAVDKKQRVRVIVSLTPLVENIEHVTETFLLQGVCEFAIAQREGWQVNQAKLMGLCGAVVEQCVGAAVAQGMAGWCVVQWVGRRGRHGIAGHRQGRSPIHRDRCFEDFGE